MAPRQLAWLRSLGVDVWVRRDVPAARQAPAQAPAANREAALPGEEALPGNVAVAEAPGAAEVAAPAAGVQEAPLRFVIRCFRQGNVFALVDEPLWRHRRLLFDIARAMDAANATERGNVEFEWPQLASADAGISAAGRAFRAFLSAQHTPGTRWLAVGARVAELVGADVDRTAHVFLADDLDGLDKRGLWREILGKR